MSARYYVTPSSMPGRFDLRQTRYKESLAKGKEHPHDLMAVCFLPADLLAAIEKWFPDTDKSALEAARP